MQQVSCSPVHSEGNLEALKAASGAVQCSCIPELFAKRAARQLLRDPSPSPPCTIHRFPPAKRPWKPMLFPNRWDPHVTQSPRNASVAVGMEGSSTVRHSRSPASCAIPHLSPITAFCQLHERQEETPYLGNGWDRVSLQWGTTAPWANTAAESRQQWQISLLTHKISWAKNLILGLG